MANSNVVPKLIKMSEASARDAAQQCAEAGVRGVSLAGSHGGDGMNSDGAWVTGIHVPLALYDAYKARARSSRCSVYEALQAGIAAALAAQKVEG